MGCIRKGLGRGLLWLALVGLVTAAGFYGFQGFRRSTPAVETLPTAQVAPPVLETPPREPPVITLLDTHTGKVRTELRGATVWAEYVSFSPDGRQLASFGFRDSQPGPHAPTRLETPVIALWDLQQGTLLREKAVGTRKFPDNGRPRVPIAWCEGRGCLAVAIGTAVHILDCQTLERDPGTGPGTLLHPGLARHQPEPPGGPAAVGKPGVAKGGAVAIALGVLPGAAPQHPEFPPG